MVTFRVFQLGEFSDFAQTTTMIFHVFYFFEIESGPKQVSSPFMLY